MTATAIHIHQLGKRYRIGTAERPDTLVGALRKTLTYPLRNWRQLNRRHRFANDAEDPSIKWALRDVSFDVPEGQVLGLIGHNGAGKSTLLKILSRITDPSTGSATLRGRVSSLLEVGTGFHQELTGRDNVFMNGTILGMRAAEVRAKFDEIVAFSGVEQYLDTPVKFYSSGMKVRLAFAVAAHLDPEILLIDEVLAVGDLAFQQKCLGKMDAVSKSGRTILFVSHNMSAVEGLCERCILMDGGRVSYDGTVEEAIGRYRRTNLQQTTQVALNNREDRSGNGAFKFERLSVNDGRAVVTGAPLRIDIGYTTERSLSRLHLAVKFCRNYREIIFTIDSRAMGIPLRVSPGTGTITIDLPRCDLLPDQYMVDLWAGESTACEDKIFNAGQITVHPSDLYGSGNMLHGRRHGYVAPPLAEFTVHDSEVRFTT